MPGTCNPFFLSVVGADTQCSEQANRMARCRSKQLEVA